MNGLELSVPEPQGPDAPQGVYVTTNYLFYFPATSANKVFVDEFKKNYKRYPKAGRVDKEKLIDALEEMVVDSPVETFVLQTDPSSI